MYQAAVVREDGAGAERGAEQQGGRQDEPERRGAPVEDPVSVKYRHSVADPGSEFFHPGSASKNSGILTQKNKEGYYSLFFGLQASPVAWTSFIEA